jgi:hypothetical protein
MSYKLFLDDSRNPEVCVHYMHLRIGPDNPLYLEEWVVVRNYDEFISTIKKLGIPDVVSFDHDLVFEHYGISQNREDHELYHNREDRQKTGYDCAQWLVNYCEKKDKLLPKWFVHSDNAIGAERITELLKSYIY